MFSSRRGSNGCLRLSSKVCSVEGVVVVTSLASQYWISAVLFIFCLVFLQMHMIIYVHTVHFD